MGKAKEVVLRSQTEGDLEMRITTWLREHFYARIVKIDHAEVPHYPRRPVLGAKRSHQDHYEAKITYEDPRRKRKLPT
jgi:hypothetical protein